MSCDLLVFAPHPDDAELYCGGTIARHVRLGHQVMIVDATRGELGSRGSVEQRAQEAATAAQTLGLSHRAQLGLPDGHLNPHDHDQRAAVVGVLRQHRPRLVLVGHGHARHPDHVALAELVAHGLKLAAIHNYQPTLGAGLQGTRLAWYEMELPIPQAQWLVPCTEADWQRKQAAIACHASQFGLDDSSGPPTAISQPDFLQWIDARGQTWGYLVGAPRAEAFAAPEPISISDLLSED